MTSQRSGHATVETESDRRKRAFRAADQCALEVFKAARALRGAEHAELAAEIRKCAARCGGAMVVAAISDPGGSRHRSRVEEAREHLVATRYYVYLARRLGLLDLRSYRRLAARHDAALRELEHLAHAPRGDP